jgi:hypothetical protein
MLCIPIEMYRFVAMIAFNQTMYWLTLSLLYGYEDDAFSRLQTVLHNITE